jgi:hypothetical protein
MKSPLKRSIGEVVTDYGARVMKVFKKGLLQRSLFDFYGDVKADKLRVKESSSVPATPIDGDGGVIYAKSADGKLYYKSNEVAEVEISSSGTTLTTEQVQDIVGAMFSGNTETRISATYEDSDGTIDLVVNAIPVDLTVDGSGSVHTNNVTDLHGAGVDGSANQLLTDDGDGSVTSEANLSFDAEVLTIGADDNGVASIHRTTHSDEAGGRLEIKSGDATGTNKNGGHLMLEGGKGTGSGTGGSIQFLSHAAGSSGDSAGILTEVASIDSSGNLQIDGDLTVSGNDIKDDDGTTCITFDSSGNTSIGGTLSCADLDITGTSNALTVNPQTGNVAINCISTDADCIVRVQDNSTAGTNVIGMVATGDDLVMRNDEGNFKVKVANNATDALILDQSGNLSLTGSISVPKRKISRTETGTHFDVQGDVLYFGSGSTTQGDLCYLKEDGSWGQADADGAATGDDEDRDAMGMLAIALGTNPLNDGMLIKGVITMDYDLGDVGNPIYVKTTAGAMTHTAPTASGDFVRVVGYCLDDTHGIMYFNPDNTWVEIA